MALVRNLALAAAVATCLTTANAATGNEPADGIVFDAIKAPVTVSYAGVVEVTRTKPNRTITQVYRVEHRAPNFTKHVFTAPASVAGDWIVMKGDESYSIDVHRHRVVHSKNGASDDQVALDDNYILLRQNYHAQKAGLTAVDGRPVREIDFVNNFTHQTSMTMLVDRDTKLVLQRREFGPDGAVVSELRFQSVTYGVQIAESEFNVPSNLPRVEGASYGAPSNDIQKLVQESGFKARNPQSLPEGFQPVEGHLVWIKGVRTLDVLYSDGIRTVSLFENAGNAAVNMSRLSPQSTSIGGQPAQYALEGRTTILAWGDENVRYALVGDLQLNELQKIAASITP